MAWRNVREAANHLSRLGATEAICLTPEKKSPLPGQAHEHTLIWTQAHSSEIQASYPIAPRHMLAHVDDVADISMSYSFCVSHSHTDTHQCVVMTEVSYLRGKSNYGFQIPLCKGILCVTPGYICTFLIQDKSSRSLRCILSLPEGWLNGCAVAVKKKKKKSSSTLLVSLIFCNIMSLQSRL